MAFSHNPRIVTSNLMWMMDFADRNIWDGSTVSNGHTMNDVVGRGYNPEFVNTSWTGQTANYGGTVTGDGSADYFTVGDGLSSALKLKLHWASGALNTGMSSDLTWEIWIKTSDNGGGNRLLVSRPWHGSGVYNYRIGHNYIGVQGHSDGNASPSYGSVSFSSIATGKWTHLVVTINSTTVNAYINGTLDSTGSHGLTAHGAPPGGHSTFFVAIGTIYPYGGSWNGNDGFTIDGEWCVVKMYDKVLNAGEVLQNFKALRGRYGV